MQSSSHCPPKIYFLIEDNLGFTMEGNLPLKKHVNNYTTQKNLLISKKYQNKDKFKAYPKVNSPKDNLRACSLRW